jgi:hypothetical protein
MPPYVNPYSIKNREALGKQHPEFGRKIGMYPKKKAGKGELTLEAILKAIMGRQQRRFKKSLAKQPYRKRVSRMTDPMGEPNLPPEEPASFGYAGGVLGGTGAPPGVPSRIYSDIAGIGQHSATPLDFFDRAGELNMPDASGFRPSDMGGIVADQRARDLAALYPTPQGPGYMPMSTAPMRPQAPQPSSDWGGEPPYSLSDVPYPMDPSSKLLQELVNKEFRYR